MSTPGDVYSYRTPADNVKRRSHSPDIVHEQPVALRSKILMIVDLRHAGHDGKALQQVTERVARDTVETEQSTRLHIAIRILLQHARFATELHEVPSGRVRGLIDDLIRVRHAVLRIVVLIAQRRESGQADVGQSLRAGIQPRLGQSDFAG